MYAKRKAPTVSDMAREAAARALERLISLLQDPETSNGDVLKASQLVFERIYTGASQQAPAGDYDIIVKEE